MALTAWEAAFILSVGPWSFRGARSATIGPWGVRALRGRLALPALRQVPMAEVVEPEATVEMPKVADCLSGEGHFQFLVRPCPATARWVEPVATEAVAAQAFEGSMAPMAA